ncbi:FxSxx-COOH system tetratricopeptide repeat protein [Actinoplanes xinjiangensis]|uniref:FxSxx-COOH system tetratricopeptide repeat protein n=1 Tax=Actinoplanes xinjiangensis TaxID=512350 RepID=UPI0034149371
MATASIIGVLVLPITTNVAASALPRPWQSYLWIAWPASLALAVVVVIVEIRRHRQSLLVAETQISPQTVERQVWNVPFPNAAFTDRKSMFMELGTVLMRGSGRPVVVAGMAGVGKTQFALAYAHSTRSKLRVGWLVPASNRVSALSSLADLAAALGFHELNRKAAAGKAVSYLSESSGWLLIFDDAYKLSDLTGLVPTGIDGAVVITSRNPGFDRSADSLLLRPFDDEHALEFLRNRSHDDDMGAAKELASALGNLPLALEHAATYCMEAGIGMAEYLQRYQRHRTILIEDPTRPASRGLHTTVRMAVDRAAKQARGVRLVLQLLSMLGPHDVPTELITGVVSRPRRWTSSVLANPLAVDRAIRALRQSSLLISASTSHLRVHELVARATRDQAFERRSPVWWKLSFASARKARTLDTAVRLIDEYLPLDTRVPPSWAKASLVYPHLEAVLGHVETQHLSRRRARRLATVVGRLGTHLFHSGDFASGEDLCRQALAICRSQGDTDAEYSQEAAFELTVILHYNGWLEEARELGEALVATRMRLYGPHDRRTIAAMNRLGGVLMDIPGSLEEAKDLFERVLAESLAIFDAEHVQVLFTRNNLAKTLRLLGEYELALDLSEQVLSVGRRVLGDDHPDVLVWIHNVAEARRATGRLEGAYELHHEALQRRITVLGAQHPLTVVSQTNLAHTAAALGYTAEARALYEEALHAAAVTLDENHRWTVDARDGLSRTAS